MKPVFEYLDYRAYLKDAYEDRKSSTPFFSYRMLAEILDVDSSNLFRILNGDMHLPLRCQAKTIQFLSISGRSAEYFVLLMAYARARSAKSRKEILDRALALRDVPSRRLEEQELAYFGAWWISALRSLVEVNHGQARAEELAGQLVPAVPASQIQAGLDLLLELGLLRKASSGRLKLSEGHLSVGGVRKVEAVRAYQRELLALASEAIGRFGPSQRDISTLTVAVDADSAKAIQGILRECRRQIQAQVEQTQRPDRVMELAMAFFPVALPREATA